MTIKKGGKAIRIYEPLAGEKISEIVQNMVALANESNEQVVAELEIRGNGIPPRIKIEANPGDDPDSIEQFYYMESEYCHERWEESPEGQRAIRREEEIDIYEKWEASPECRRQRAILEDLKHLGK